jgi:uncharacterized protein YndB with AHSA1/START domain
MKILKYIGIGIIGFIALVLIIPAFLSSKTTVTRSAIVTAPADTVFSYLSNFNNFTQWSPWYEKEPSAVVTVVGVGTGSKYSWVGKKVGAGSMTIVGLEPNKAVDIKLEFTEPWQSVATTKWSVAPAENGSKVTWEMSQDLSYLKRYFGLKMDEMIGPDFEKGLSNLKDKLDKK